MVHLVHYYWPGMKNAAFLIVFVDWCERLLCVHKTCCVLHARPVVFDKKPSHVPHGSPKGTRLSASLEADAGVMRNQVPLP